MTCPQFDAAGPSAIAGALRTVDCMSADATAIAFSRLFGGEGMLTAALTIALTLYVALFAIGLLTGRATIGLSSLTPRMMGLGLALTFASSWVAYSQVIWTLLAAGPDWVAAILLGVKGSASQAFAARLDLIFGAVMDAAAQAQEAAKEAKGTTPADLLSYAALLLLLGTVGVLVTSRIALGALIALGPIFVILALFSGTRGFEGWLRTAVMFALAPLFAVLIGVGSVAMLDAVVVGLAGGEVDLRQAAVVFVVAAIHCALMATSLRLVAGLTSGWRIPFAAARAPLGTAARASTPDPRPAPGPAVAVERGPTAPPNADERVRAVVAAGSVRGAGMTEPAESRVVRLPGATITSVAPGVVLPAPGQARARDLGRTLRSAPASSPIKETSA